MPLGKRKSASKSKSASLLTGSLDGSGRRGRRTEHRIADALERIAHHLDRIADRQAATTLTQDELDELYIAATSTVTASDGLQARLRQAMGKTQGAGKA